jgi:hypothetical protein
VLFLDEILFVWMGMSLETAVQAEGLSDADSSPDYEDRLTLLMKIQEF